MATRDDDSFTAPPERLLQDAQARPDGDEPAWVRARAAELLHSLDDFQVPIGGKQRLLLRLGQGWHGRRVAWLRPVVVGAILIGIGGGAIASAALTEWPAWVARSYRKLMSTSAGSQALPPAPEKRTDGEPARTDLGPVAAEPAPIARPAPAPRVPAPPRRAAAERARATSGGRRASRRSVPGRGRDARAARRTRPAARARPGDQLPRSPARRRAGRRSAGHLHRSGHRSSRSGRGSFERQVPRAVPRTDSSAVSLNARWPRRTNGERSALSRGRNAEWGPYPLV